METIEVISEVSKLFEKINIGELTKGQAELILSLIPIGQSQIDAITKGIQSSFLQ